MSKGESRRKRNKTKLKSQMLFFSIVIQPSTEQEREINQIQSEILTSYIYMISTSFDFADMFS